MKRPSIKMSLIMVFAVIVALCLVLSEASYSGLNNTNGATSEIATNWLPSVKSVNAINTATSDYRVAEGAHVMSTAADEKRWAESDLKALNYQISSLRKDYEKLISSDHEREVYEKFSKDWAQYLELHNTFIDLSKAEKVNEAVSLFKGEMRKVYNASTAQLVELIAINDKGASEAYASSQASYTFAFYGLVLILVLIAVALAGGIAIVLLGISKPINRITAAMLTLARGDTDTAIPYAGRADEIGAMAGALEVFRQGAIASKQMERDAEINRRQAEMNRIADQERAEAEAAERMRQATSGLAAGLKRLAAGDLSFQLTEAFAADFEALRQDFNLSVKQLGNTLSSVADSVGSITNGSEEISTGANDLSKRTEQQAAALEETAAALDQITANVTSSSKRAEEARKVATEANQSATKSGEVVDQAVNAMSRIEQSSSQISNIIGVIDEIAFQTNLLALNAGVEAARAGDAGKGFAVVAQEVRELAQRSASAAKEIKGLIQTSTTEVASGVKLVSETGTALKSIGEFIVAINAHMEAIALSSREQSVGLAEVNTAVNQMDQTTQQNAAMVEQSSAAASSLANEASNLRQLISQFDLGNASGQAQALRHTASRMAQPAHTASYRAPARKAAGGGAAVTQEWSEF
jgi:methyl-accepting chemotaxis protein